MIRFIPLKKDEQPIDQSADEVGMTQEACQQLLRRAGLTMLSRFHQVHALCEEREYGQNAVYELYICQRDQLTTLTPTRFLELVQEAQSFRTRLQRAV